MKQRVEMLSCYHVYMPNKGVVPILMFVREQKFERLSILEESSSVEIEKWQCNEERGNLSQKQWLWKDCLFDYKLKTLSMKICLFNWSWNQYGDKLKALSKINCPFNCTWKTICQIVPSVGSWKQCLWKMFLQAYNLCVCPDNIVNQP